MLRSMTGYGSGSNAGVRVEIACVNHRGVQVAVRSELGLGLDDEVRVLVRDALGRGSAQVRIEQGVGAATVDRDGLAATWRMLAELARELGAAPPRLDVLLRAQSPSISRADADTPAAVVLRRSVLAATAAALAALDTQRVREGAALAAALRERSAGLRQLRHAMLAAAAPRRERWRDELALRATAALARLGHGPIPPEILAREVVLQAERIDIGEELDRLSVHLDALDALLREDSGAQAPDSADASPPSPATKADAGHGRRLDFLAQEISRELSTTGAKANDAALAALVIDARILADQIKEQAANVC